MIALISDPWHGIRQCAPISSSTCSHFADGMLCTHLVIYCVRGNRLTCHHCRPEFNPLPCYRLLQSSVVRVDFRNTTKLHQCNHLNSPYHIPLSSSDFSHHDLSLLSSTDLMVTAVCVFIHYLVSIFGLCGREFVLRLF